MTLLEELSSSWKLRRCASVGPGARATGLIWIHGPGVVQLGARVVLDASRAPIQLKTFTPESRIILGDDVVVESGTSIEAVLSVEVGARTRLGCFSKLMDNNFHPLTGNRLERPPSAPVLIGEDVEIGVRAILLAGAHVGSGATVRAGTVITRRLRVPERGIAQGLPAVLR